MALLIYITREDGWPKGTTTNSWWSCQVLVAVLDTSSSRRFGYEAVPGIRSIWDLTRRSEGILENFRERHRGKSCRLLVSRISHGRGMHGKLSKLWYTKMRRLDLGLMPRIMRVGSEERFGRTTLSKTRITAWMRLSHYMPMIASKLFTKSLPLDRMERNNHPNWGYDLRVWR